MWRDQLLQTSPEPLRPVIHTTQPFWFSRPCRSFCPMAHSCHRMFVDFPTVEVTSALLLLIPVPNSQNYQCSNKKTYLFFLSLEIRMLNRVGRIWNPSVRCHQHHRTCHGRRRRPVRSGLCRRRRRDRRRRRPRPGRDELDYAAAAAGSWMSAGDASAAGARPRRRSPRQHGWPWPAGAARDGNVAANLRCPSLYIRTASETRTGWMDGWMDRCPNGVADWAVHAIYGTVCVCDMRTSACLCHRVRQIKRSRPIWDQNKIQLRYHLERFTNFSAHIYV
jgi:hypothetical protein